MTIREFYNGFINLLEKEHRLPDSFRWPLPLVLFHMESVRSLVLDTKYNQENKPVDYEDMHMIPCIPLKKASKIDCEVFKELGCEDVMKSKDPLPELITEEDLIVRSIDGSHKFDYIRWEEYTQVLNSKFVAEKEGVYYSLKREQDGIFVYILNDKVKSITFEGVFHSIVDPYIFPTCKKEDFSCTDFTKFKIPMSPSKRREMYDLTYQSLLNIDRVAEVDTKGNESPDLTNPTL